MTDFLVYDLKVAVCIAVFYMFYRLLLSHETFHRVNRLVLLLTAVLSFILPLCVITIHETVTVAMSEVSVGELQGAMVIDTDPAPPLWQSVLPILYIIGMTATLSHSLLSVMKVCLLIRRSEKHLQPDGTTICVTGNAVVAPFSWMRYIVMNRDDYEMHDAAILAHERGHIRLWHSLDVILVDLLTALQWYNPAMWMLRQDLRAIHEYEADGEVLSHGISARQYQYLLISKATSIGGYSIANGINHSTLKNRIHMMTNMKSKSSHLWKLLALLPIIGTALALNAHTVTEYVYEKPQTQQSVKKGRKAGNMKLNSQNIQVVTTESPSAEQDDGKTFKMQGIVKDKEKGEPVVGAIVKVGNTQKGVVTGIDGTFSIDVKKGDVVVAAYIGYESDAIVIKEPKSNYVFVLQKDGTSSEKTFDVVEQMPQFPGGPATMMEFLKENIRYPEEAQKKGLQGRVVVSFIVRKDGSIDNCHVARSVDPLLDAEAVRVIRSMPNWTPGMQDGKAVAVRYNVPVSFRLDAVNDKPNDVIANQDVDIEVDGKLVDANQLQQIKSGEIDNITVVNAKDKSERTKIIVKTKKNQ